MLPKLLQEPRTAGGPNAGTSQIGRRRIHPYICSMVRDPATASIEFTRRSSAGLSQLFRERQQRLIGLRKARVFRWPITFLDVDIQSPPALPSPFHVV